MPFIVLTYGKTRYHINYCKNCLSSVAVHMDKAVIPVDNNYLEENIPCCEHPDRRWDIPEEDSHA